MRNMSETDATKNEPSVTSCLATVLCRYAAREQPGLRLRWAGRKLKIQIVESERTSRELTSSGVLQKYQTRRFTFKTCSTFPYNASVVHTSVNIAEEQCYLT